MVIKKRHGRTAVDTTREIIMTCGFPCFAGFSTHCIVLKSIDFQPKGIRKYLAPDRCVINGPDEAAVISGVHGVS